MRAEERGYPRLRSGRVPFHTRRGGGAAVLLLALFGLAVAVRWWGLPSQVAAMYGDEAQVLGEARKFIEGVYTTPFMIDQLNLSAVYDFLLSFPLRWAGSMDVTVARGFSGVVGALSVPLLYLTARELGYTGRVGLVAAVVLATTFWDVHWSRLALPNIMPVGMGSVAILLTVLAVRRSSIVLALLGGVALGWTVDAHLSGTPMVPVIGLWLLALLAVSTRGWRQERGELAPPDRDAPGVAAGPQTMPWWMATLSLRGRGPLLDLGSPRTWPRLPALLAVAIGLGLAALVAVWPLLTLYLAPGSALRGHVGARFILAPENRLAFASTHPQVGSDILSILWYQLKATLGMFSVRGDPDPIFNDPNRPLLDLLSGGFFALGLLTTLQGWRRPASVLILLWLALPLAVGTLLTNGTTPWSDTPDTSRSVAAAPAMCLLIGLGLETVVGLLDELVSRIGSAGRASDLPAWWPPLRLGVVMALVAALAVVGVQRYWSFVAAPVHHQRFYTGTREWAVFISHRGVIPVTVVSPSGYPGEFVRLYAPAALVCSAGGGTAWTPCPSARMVIFDTDQPDAQRYGALTHVPIHGFVSDDGQVRFWYGEGVALPDPAHVMTGR